MLYAPESQTQIKLGDIVTLSYESQSTNDVLRDPIISRVRSDVSWEEIVHNFFRERCGLSKPWPSAVGFLLSRNVCIQLQSYVIFR